MKKTIIAVRDVDDETFQKFKTESVKERLKLGVALSIAMASWLNKKENGKSKKGLQNTSPIRVGNKKVTWSIEIDEAVYAK